MDRPFGMNIAPVCLKQLKVSTSVFTQHLRDLIECCQAGGGVW